MKKQIEKSAWQDRLQSFNSGNKGRPADLDSDGRLLAEKKSFMSVDYDPKGKGNDIMITLDGYGHTVDVPKEVYITEESNGVVSMLEIVDRHGESTFLILF